METLADALPGEISRVSAIQRRYDKTAILFDNDVFPTKAIFDQHIAPMAADIQRASQAMAEGDTVEMLRCYEALKRYPD